MATESRILHVYADLPGCLSAAVARHAGISVDDALRWMQSGAVYCDGVRVREEKKLRGGEYLRLHRSPRQFPEAANVAWDQVIIAEEPDFLLVDKPADVPMHPTLDNAEQNVLSRLEQTRGEKLYVTQRLDLPTSGLCVIARNKSFQSAFNRMLADGAVEKHYRAIAQGFPALGRHVAYQEPSDRAPRVMAHEARPGWRECILHVESVAPAANDDCLVTIRLETGRTHQIRAQLALLGFPLRGDILYGGSPTADGRLSLRSFELAFNYHRVAYRWRRDTVTAAFPS